MKWRGYKHKRLRALDFWSLGAEQLELFQTVMLRLVRPQLRPQSASPSLMTTEARLFSKILGMVKGFLALVDIVSGRTTKADVCCFARSIQLHRLCARKIPLPTQVSACGYGSCCVQAHGNDINFIEDIKIEKKSAAELGHSYQPRLGPSYHGPEHLPTLAASKHIHLAYRTPLVMPALAAFP